MSHADNEWTMLVGTFDRPVQIWTARNLLIAHGIDAERVTVVERPDQQSGPGGGRSPGRDPHYREGSAAAAGAMMGSYIGLTTLGPFAPVAIVAGGLIGMLVGLGLPRGEAEEYGEELLAGRRVLVIRLRSDEVEPARRILRQAEGRVEIADAQAADLERAAADPAAVRAVGAATQPTAVGSPSPPAPVAAPAESPLPIAASAAREPGRAAPGQPAGEAPAPSPEIVRLPGMIGPGHVTYGHTGRGRQTAYGFRGPNLDNRGEREIHSDPY